MPTTKYEEASLSVSRLFSAPVIESELVNKEGILTIKLFRKCTVIGINIFLYFKYKIQFAIPKIIAPTTANSTCKIPNNIDENIIPIYTSKILDNLLKITTLNSNSSSIGAVITVKINTDTVFVKISSPELFSEFAISKSIKHTIASIKRVVPKEISICVNTTFKISFMFIFTIKSCISLFSLRKFTPKIKNKYIINIQSIIN